ncbi:isochorismate synthase, partial [Paracoccus yeei]
MSEAPEILAPLDDDPVLFAFQGPHGRVQGRGAPVQVPRGGADTVAARVGQALSGALPGAMIGGALPFDRTQADCLWLCNRAAPQPAAAA